MHCMLKGLVLRLQLPKSFTALAQVAGLLITVAPYPRHSGPSPHQVVLIGYALLYTTTRCRNLLLSVVRSPIRNWP